MALVGDQLPDPEPYERPGRQDQPADRHHRGIAISFGTGNHNDNFPFDGLGGTYAHAYYPPPAHSGMVAGDIHFDDAESWTTNTCPDGTQPIDLQTVALHEVGPRWVCRTTRTRAR